MSPDNRQNLKIFLILFVVLAATFWIGREISKVPVASPDGSGNPALAESRGGALAAPQALSEWLDDPASGVIGENGRNPFQYGLEPAPPPPDVSVDPESSSSDAEAPVQTPPEIAPPAPPPPPPIPFRYNGYAVVDSTGRINALLFDEDRGFIVSAQDVLMGRYRVNQVTEMFVEIEDLEFGRRQRLPLTIQ